MPETDLSTRIALAKTKTDNLAKVAKTDLRRTQELENITPEFAAAMEQYGTLITEMNRVINHPIWEESLEQVWRKFGLTFVYDFIRQRDGLAQAPKKVRKELPFLLSKEVVSLAKTGNIYGLEGGKISIPGFLEITVQENLSLHVRVMMDNYCAFEGYLTIQELETALNQAIKNNDLSQESDVYALGPILGIKPSPENR